jgi:two-component system NarL family sensor kinase
VVDKVSYVIDLPKWNWVLGTGAYLDDVYAQTSAATLAMKERTRESFVMAAFFAVPAILIVFTGCVYVTLDERKMADGILKQLTQRVIDTQEQERSRLARELHDGVSQELLGVRFTMDLVGRNAAASTPDLDAAIKESIAALNNTIREIRAISHDLRPRILDDIGLAAAIKNLAEKLASRTGITLSLTSDRFVDNLPPAVRTAIFRVAQEALSNVERHSKASWLEIGLWSERGQARIRISDNGRGIDPGLASEGSGLGLQNMRERVSHFGGTLLIDSSPRGTSLLVRLPRPEGESKTPRRIAS